MHAYACIYLDPDQFLGELIRLALPCLTLPCLASPYLTIVLLPSFALPLFPLFPLFALRRYMTGFIVLSTMLIAVDYAREGIVPVPPQGLWQWALVLAYIISAQIAQITLAIGFKHEGAAVGGVLQNLELAFAFTLDAFFLGEAIEPWAVVGAFVIFFGAVIAGLGKTSAGASDDDTDDTPLRHSTLKDSRRHALTDLAST